MLFLFHLAFYETTECLTTCFQETFLCLPLRARQESAESCVFLQVAGEKHGNDDSIKSNDKGKMEHFTSFTYSSVAADFYLFTASSLKEALDLHSLSPFSPS